MHVNLSGRRIGLLLMGGVLSFSSAAVVAQSPAGTPLPTASGASDLQVYAAGSLREPLTALAAAYQAQTGVRISLTFGASGLLRERIEKGEPAQVFASADTQHPATLAASSAGWQASTVFVSNALCALTAPAVQATPASLLELLLDPAVLLGTSTPLNDPSGDYTWALFRKAETLQTGAFARLDAKAIKLTGFAEAPKPPAGRGTYAWLMAEGRADVFLTYCTNALSASKEVPGLKVVALPPALQVSAAYGVTAKSGDASAAQFASYLLSAPAQTVFAGFGFGPP